MTHRQHADQRARVVDSLSADERRDHHRDVYSRHPLSRAVPQGEPTIGSLAVSIRELGEMLAAADAHPDYRARLMEVERLADRVAERVASVRALVLREYEDVA